MKILRLLTVLVIAALTFAACDDTTEGIGGSITNDIDNINITSAVFPVATKSMVSGAVLSRNNSGLIGKMKDPETGNYVKGDYMTQLSVLPTFSGLHSITSSRQTKVLSRQTHATSWFHTNATTRRYYRPNESNLATL